MGSSSDSGGGFSSQSTPTPQQLAAAQQASQLQQAGGLQYRGAGLPLVYVPPTPAFQAASQANSAQMNAAAQQVQQPLPQPQVQSNNGQGFVNGPSSAAGTNPYSTLTPQQQALYALQAQSGQTPGGLMVGPNHTLVQAPAPLPSNINTDPNGAQPTDQQPWNLPTSNGPM